MRLLEKFLGWFKNKMWFKKKPHFPDLNIIIDQKKNLYVFLIPQSTRDVFSDYITRTMGESDRYKIIFFSEEGKFRGVIALNMPTFVLISYSTRFDIIPPNLYHTTDGIFHFSRIDEHNFSFRRVTNVASRNTNTNSGIVKVA